MNRFVSVQNLFIAFAVICPTFSQAQVANVPVKMTVSVSVPRDRQSPEIKAEDVIVRRGRDRLKVTEWTPATGANAGMDLFILIDDASDPVLGSHLNDLRSFITSQPPSTNVGVGYMRNATVQITQNFTNDHDAAARAVRLPLGNVGAFGSPYLSVMDLMRRWPEHPNRRQVIMLSDGIDRARRGMGRTLNTLPDVNSASDLAQRTGTMIHSIYVPGRSRLDRNFWEANNGINNMAQLSDRSGGENFFIGFGSPVSIKPYLDQLNDIFGNQYLLGFEATPARRAGLQFVNVGTEIPGVDLSAADAVWVPAASGN
jgi:hypothetical protein